jgi:hypothetical protein
MVKNHLRGLSFVMKFSWRFISTAFLLQSVEAVVCRRIYFSKGFPKRNRLRAPNSCGIGKQPLDRKVDLAMRFSIELFNEQVMRP